MGGVLKKKAWFITLAVVMTILLITITGCGPAEEEVQVVKIGLAQPLTGACANDGQMSRDGAELALEHLKDKAGLEDYEIIMQSEDDQSDPKEAAAIANKFSGDDKILAVIGNYNSSCTLAAAPILEEAGIPQISTGSSSPQITGFSDYLFRTQPTDALVGENMVDWAIELDFSKAAVIYENTDFGLGLQGVFNINWPGDNRSIVVDESYTPGSTVDFTPLLTKIKEEGADVVLMGSLYNDASLMGKQAKQIELDIMFFGDTSQHTNALLELGKDGVEDFHVVGAMDHSSEDPLVVSFINDFIQKYGHEPNTFAAQGYDAMALLLEGLAKNGPDRAKIQEYLFTVKDFPGVTGRLSFKDGDVEKQLFRFVVKDGEFVRVER